MATPFDALTLADVQRLAGQTTPAWAADNRTLYDGDHWNGGKFWIGPAPAPTDADAAQVIAEIQRAFVSKNAVREVVGRHVAGVIGREPAWGYTPRRPLRADKKTGKKKLTQAEQALIDEAEAALTSWWDERGALALLQECAATLLLSGRGALRLFVPSGLLVDGQVPQGDLATQLSRIYLHHPSPRQAVIVTDPATQLRCSIYVYQEQQLDGSQGQTCAEVSYVDPADGMTVLRVLTPTTDTAVRLPLGGHLMLSDMARPALVTDSVRQSQMQLNLARTMEGRNAVQGGFLERIVLGGQMPGSYVDDPTAPAGPNGERKRFVPGRMRLGAGRTNWIAGIPIRDEQGRVTGYTTPSVVYRDPVSPETFQLTAGASYRAILEEVQQLHALIAGDATASGESRKQARADFEKSLGPTKAQVDKLVRWILETALALASHFAGQGARYTALRATCDCRVDTGPLGSEERKAILDQVAAGLLSKETALALLGIEDVDAELARIAAEQAESAARAQASGLPAPQSQGQQDAGGGAPTGERGQQQGQQPATGQTGATAQ